MGMYTYLTNLDTDIFNMQRILNASLRTREPSMTYRITLIYWFLTSLSFAWQFRIYSSDLHTLRWKNTVN